MWLDAYRNARQDHRIVCRAVVVATGDTAEGTREVTDTLVEGWGQHFGDEELIELGTFMAFADGFGKLVELLGLGDADQSCDVEV